MVDAGKLDTRIEIEALSVGEDEFGAEVKSWQAFITVWAMVSYGTGAERQAIGAQEQASLPVAITVRYSAQTAAVTPGQHRLRFGGKDWDIESAAPGPGRNETIVILARARV